METTNFIPCVETGRAESLQTRRHRGSLHRCCMMFLVKQPRTKRTTANGNGRLTSCVGSVDLEQKHCDQRRFSACLRHCRLVCSYAPLQSRSDEQLHSVCCLFQSAPMECHHTADYLSDMQTPVWFLLVCADARAQRERPFHF